MNIEVPALADGTVHGGFIDSNGAPISYALRGADGSLDFFRADLDIRYVHHEFRVILDHSDDLGTRYYQLLVKDPESDEFKDLMNPFKFNTAAVAARYIIDKDLVHVIRDALSHQFKVKYGDNVDLSKCAFVEGKMQCR